MRVLGWIVEETWQAAAAAFLPADADITLLHVRASDAEAVARCALLGRSRTHYLHGYHEAVPPMALIALFAPMARSTNRSTAAAPDPLILLLCVTSLAAPGLCQEPGPSPEHN